MVGQYLIVIVSTAANSTPPLDLSKLTRLRGVLFGCGQLGAQWITRTLQTAESPNLEQVIIRYETLTAQSVYREWQGLDHLLLQFWTSRSIRPKIGYRRGKDIRGLRELVPKLLPELTSRGVIYLIEIDDSKNPTAGRTHHLHQASG